MRGLEGKRLVVAAVAIGLLPTAIYIMHALGTGGLARLAEARDLPDFRLAGTMGTLALLTRGASILRILANPSSFAQILHHQYPLINHALRDWSYPPTMMLFLMPLKWGSVSAAWLCLLLIDLICTAAVVRVVMLHFPDSGRWTWLCLAAPALWDGAAAGQNNVLLGSAAVVGLILIARGNLYEAAVVPDGEIRRWLARVGAAALIWMALVAAGLPLHDVLILGGLVVMVAAAARPDGRWRSQRRAGLLFGLMTVKPTMGVLIPVAVLARRSSVTLLVAGVVGLSMVAATAVLWPTAWADFLHWTAPAMTARMQRPVVPTPSQAYMASPYIFLRWFGLSNEFAMIIQGCLTAFAVIMVYKMFSDIREEHRVHEGGRPDADFRRIVAMAALMAMASPYLLDYDLYPVSVLLIAGYMNGWISYGRHRAGQIAYVAGLGVLALPVWSTVAGIVFHIPSIVWILTSLTGVGLYAAADAPDPVEDPVGATLNAA